MTPNVNYNELRSRLAAKLTRRDLLQAIVDLPFEDKKHTTALSLGIVVLLEVDPITHCIDRVALSNTDLAKGTTDISAMRFEDIKIPLDARANIIAEVIRTNSPRFTTDWQYLFTPVLTAKQARLNQAGGAIAYSAVYPVGGSHGGAMIFSYYQYPQAIGDSQHDFMERYSQLVTERLKSIF